MLNTSELYLRTNVLRNQGASSNVSKLLLNTKSDSPGRSKPMYATNYSLTLCAPDIAVLGRFLRAIVD